MSVLRSLFVAPSGEAVASLKKAANYLLVCVAVILVVGCSLGAVGITLNFDFVGQYRLRIFDGFMLTVWLSVASLIGSMLIGVPVALGKNSRILPIRYLCDLYVKIIRGTPLIAQIYLFYYIIGTAWGVENRVVAGISSCRSSPVPTSQRSCARATSRSTAGRSRRHAPWGSPASRLPCR